MDQTGRHVKISWRGDGEMFCVSFLMSSGSDDDSKHQTASSGQNWILYSLNEPMSGLQWTMSWRPSGAVIAAPVRKPNKQIVSFFEKNGLVHGGLADLCWSPDSNIFAVTVSDSILLYRTCRSRYCVNYHDTRTYFHS